MFGNVTPEEAITFARCCTALNGAWPPPLTASKLQVMRFKFLRALGILSGLTLFFPLLYALYVHRDDAIVFTKVICLVFAVCHILAQSCLNVVHYERYQALIETMIVCCEKAKSYEKTVLQQYVDRYSTFYRVSVVWFYATAVVFIGGTLFVSQTFPTDAEYPFAVDYEPLRSTIFLHQAIVGLQCAAIVCISVFAALLLLFAAARFEILMLELHAVKSIETLIRCVKKYHRVRSYAQEVVAVVRYIALVATIMATLPLVFSGLHIIGREPFAIKVQFMLMGGTALLEIFMYALPADNLLNVSENTLRSLYESTWYEENLKMQKTVVRAIVPLQPIVISVSCVIPILSLNYYCSFVSNAFSLFTAMRLMVNDEDES